MLFTFQVLPVEMTDQLVQLKVYRSVYRLMEFHEI
jgi:hypothetical protein